MEIRINQDRIWRDIETFSTLIDTAEQGYTRISFSEQDNQAKEHLRQLMIREAGMTVRIDAAANLIGRRPGKTNAPVLMMGSHLDTVRGGGRFDGIAGVVAALEVARCFHEMSIETHHPLEVVSFQAEEPSPFGLSTIGSRSMAGRLSENDLEQRDANGRRLAEAVRFAGGDPEKISTAQQHPGDIHTYLELHIEQGPRLAAAGAPIGIVSAIFGIARGVIEITGRPDHSGTTPMSRRKDALCAAADTIRALENTCRGRADDTVGAIGRLAVYPNALNVIPGKVEAGFEVRAAAQETLQAVVRNLEQAAAAIERQRGVRIHIDWRISSQPVFFPRRLIETIESACRDLSADFRTMPSGAGHDAGHVAHIAPSAMVFVPSRDGRSHCPEEWTDIEHIALGARVLAQTLLKRDRKESR